jgi:hypothetical protein
VRLASCSREDPPVVAFADGICRCVLAAEEGEDKARGSRDKAPA